jgi:small subunit ribosomal protein S21
MSLSTSPRRFSPCIFSDLPFRSFSFFNTASALNGVKLICTEEEPIENTLRRFKRAVNQSGHLMDLRHKEQWETAADKVKRKAERARMLNKIERTNDKYERRADGVSEYNS